MRFQVEVLFTCTLGGGKSVGFCEGSAQTLALALLAAILRAQGGKDAD